MRAVMDKVALFRVLIFDFRFSGLGFDLRVSGFDFQLLGFKFRHSGFGFRVGCVGPMWAENAG